MNLFFKNDIRLGRRRPKMASKSLDMLAGILLFVLYIWILALIWP